MLSSPVTSAAPVTEVPVPAVATLPHLQAEVETAQLQLELAELRTRQKLLESQQTLFDGLVDPREALLGDDGTNWQRLGGRAGTGGDPAALTPPELDQIRAACRQLTLSNEFALSGHENRINYLVGTGHKYRVTPRGLEDTALASAAQRVIERFLAAQSWAPRQQEIVRRMDRDGECFLRFFPASPTEGYLAVRFVEPEQVAAPAEQAVQAAASWGIWTEPDDVESVLGYWIDGRLVPAEEVQHRKANVDRNSKRGLPTFYPVLANLQRIEKLLRNMAVLAQTQAAIAVIRKHQHAGASSVQNFADASATFRTASNSTGAGQRYKRLAPGTILDVPAGVDYQFPSLGVDASKFVEILQAELRAVASRLVMPEFMLTADANRANYSSTLVAEGPAVKMFQRLQSALIDDDLRVLWRVLQRAAWLGELPGDVQHRLALQAEAPSLVVRDALSEAQANEIKFRNGVLSRRTWQLQVGLDPGQESRNADSGE